MKFFIPLLLIFSCSSTRYSKIAPSSTDCNIIISENISVDSKNNYFYQDYKNSSDSLKILSHSSINSVSGTVSYYELAILKNNNHLIVKKYNTYSKKEEIDTVVVNQAISTSNFNHQFYQCFCKPDYYSELIRIGNNSNEVFVNYNKNCYNQLPINIQKILALINENPKSR